ncbi:Monoamine oxidase [Acidisarcina polymorpha]|uniref:Amine oxidase n=1 Tax=Acidisarcina polymorpha TaxID=2211140 RepID=A0A2Z5FW78_9BACT|nr:primary-amine oxidase [Acidisarcina polymorpha]AXC11143.1 Monoamine oxidase [Acidisarcina polymorpha]
MPLQTLEPLPVAKSTLHPLEPLSAAEIQTAVELLRTADGFTPSTRIISIILKEPEKSLVYSWPQGPAAQREAVAVLFDNAVNQASTVTLDLSSGRVLKAEIAPAGSQPTLSIDEQFECEQAVLASEDFKAALERQYGITDTSLVMVDIWSAGNYGSEEDRSRRLARPLCFLRSDPTDNGYARPIEGIRPIVDLNLMQVIRVEEYGKWPLPPQAANYSADRVPNQRTGIKPLHITQPDGPSFSLQGNFISWQNWQFLIGFNAREGLTIHDVRYHDQGRARPILYRASLTEMVVPYGDPKPTQVRKNAFDVGEYGMGMCANSLRLGCDCVGHIEYLDAHLCDSRGRELTIGNAICIHEEDFGILWKHTDRRLPDAPEVRRSRRLVVSSVSTVENYEYGFFWYFYQDGNIGFEIKLTGILSLGTLHEGEKANYGRLVAPLLYAPNHQHFFNMRLDVGIDGSRNTVQQVDVVAGPVDGDEDPYENAFHVEATDLKTEKQALAHLNLETGRTWKFINPSVKNALGEPTGYKFFPGDNAFPFASPNAWWRKRAGFVNHHVWVTPYSEGEKFAAGDFPNQSSGGDGLVKWVEADRPIDNTDVVFWYTFGHTHIPRPEDCPVMPTAYIGFLLKPNGFFDQNPANDVPPSKQEGKACKHC